MAEFQARTRLHVVRVATHLPRAKSAPQVRDLPEGAVMISRAFSVQSDAAGVDNIVGIGDVSKMTYLSIKALRHYHEPRRSRLAVQPRPAHGRRAS